MENKFTKLEEKEIAEVLGDFGLNQKEQDVYLALLGMDQATLTPLGRMTGLPVTTVQSVVNRLAEKGLVSVTMKKTRKVFAAHAPVVLKKILEEQIRSVNNILPLLKKAEQKDKPESRIKVYFRERMTDIFNEALNCKDKTIYEIVAAKDFQEIIGEKFHFTRRRVEQRIELKSLRVEAREIKQYSQAVHAKELREAKFLPRELTFHSSVMFWDDKVAYLTTRGESLGWVVESASQAEMWRQLFELLWSVSRKMETGG